MAELIAFLDTKQMTLIDKLNDIYNTYDWILFSSLSLIKINGFQQVDLKNLKLQKHELLLPTFQMLKNTDSGH